MTLPLPPREDDHAKAAWNLEITRTVNALTNQADSAATAAVEPIVYTGGDGISIDEDNTINVINPFTTADEQIVDGTPGQFEAVGVQLGQIQLDLLNKVTLNTEQTITGPKTWEAETVLGTPITDARTTVKNSTKRGLELQKGNGSPTSIGSDGDDTFVVSNPTDEYMRISATGQMGIGTDNPTQVLHIKGTNENNTFIAVEPSQVANGGGVKFLNHSANVFGLLTSNLSDGTVELEVGGAKRLSVSSTVLENDVILRNGNGTVSEPTVSFSSATSTGMYRPAPHTIGLTTAGQDSMILAQQGWVTKPRQPYAHVRSSSFQIIQPNSPIIITYGALVDATVNMTVNLTEGTLTAQVAGLYMITGELAFDTEVNNLQIGIFINGGAVLSGPDEWQEYGNGLGSSRTVLRKINQGDQINMRTSYTGSNSPGARFIPSREASLMATLLS